MLNPAGAGIFFPVVCSRPVMKSRSVAFDITVAAATATFSDTVLHKRLQF